MKINLFTDYSLRILLYLGLYPERLVPVPEIAANYGISKNHLVKVVGHLNQLGLVEPVRGRGGGLRLARPPSEVRIGEVVRLTEGTMDLVECFDKATNTCPIDPVCGLKHALQEAQDAFIASLDRYTLADVLSRPTPLRALLVRARARREAEASPSA